MTCLAGALVVGLHAIVAERTRAFVGAAVGLAAAHIRRSSLPPRFRLRLYQEAYGWTELRFYIYATIGWLGIGIVAAVVLLAPRPDALAAPRDGDRRRSRSSLVVNVVGPQRYVAEQNVARLLDPSLVPPDGADRPRHLLRA